LSRNLARFATLRCWCEGRERIAYGGGQSVGSGRRAASRVSVGGRRPASAGWRHAASDESIRSFGKKRRGGARRTGAGRAREKRGDGWGSYLIDVYFGIALGFLLLGGGRLRGGRLAALALLHHRRVLGVSAVARRKPGQNESSSPRDSEHNPGAPR
jgi:hypothetical protein